MLRDFSSASWERNRKSLKQPSFRFLLVSEAKRREARRETGLLTWMYSQGWGDSKLEEKVRT